MFELFQFPFPRDSFCNSRPQHRGRLIQFLFQFPFPRDSFCNVARVALICITISFRFSSLFLGIPFATRWSARCGARARMVSVPFSSGFLLQLFDEDQYEWIDQFQFPFPRDSFCNKRCYMPAAGYHKFQFPFPRDSFCNQSTA